MPKSLVLQVLIIALVAAGVGTAVSKFAFHRNRAVSRPSGSSIPTLDPEHPCGPVSTSIVGRLLGRPIPLREAIAEISTDALGRSSMTELIRGLRALGFPAVGVQLPGQAAKHVGVPIIAHVRDSHFIVIIRAKDGKFITIDPPHPVKTRSLSALQEDWGGLGILVAPDERSLAAAIQTLGFNNQW